MDIMEIEMKRISEMYDVDRKIFESEILSGYKPVVIRGAFRNWPMVNAAKNSAQVSVDYMKQFYRGHPVDIFLAPPTAKGHFFYQQDMRDFNFQRLKIAFDQCLDQILLHRSDPTPPTIYMGSTPLEMCLPGASVDNKCSLLDEAVVPRLWIGNATRVQPHFDTSDNLAGVVAGRRRFVLFPPEQIDNLYIGPIDLTPAGQPMSLVDVTNPDLDRFPKFKHAMQEAMVAELGPGDAIFIPTLWWHGVEALETYNVLVNYWWRKSMVNAESPYNALIHGLLTIKSLPQPEREAWKCFFDHYVFRMDGNPVEHLPENARGILGQLTPKMYQLMKSYVLKKLNMH